MKGSRNAALSVAFSLVLPPVLLLQAWQASSVKTKHWLLTFFFVLYGATISIAYDPLGAGPDGVRHLLNVHRNYMHMTFADFLESLWLILTFRGHLAPSPDVFKHVLSFFVGRVLGVPSLFFPIVAGVYGYFFVGSMLIVFRHFSWKGFNWIILGFALIFFLAKNIEGVNTVRTWTGLWILVYACLRYFESRERKYLILMFVPPFVHFAYFIMAIPAWFVAIFGPRPRLFGLLFIASSFTTILNPAVVTEVFQETEIGEHRVRAYFVEERADAKGLVFLQDGRQLRWYAQLQRLGFQKWGLNVLIYVILLTGIYVVAMTPAQKSMLSVGLLTLTVSNSTWFLYALSGRTWLIGAVFVLAAFLMARMHPEMKRKFPYANPIYQYGLLLALLLLTPYLLYNLSVLLDFPSIYLIALPFMAILAPELNISLKELAQAILLWLL